MSDIVERLRHHKAGRFEAGVNERLMDEAADEIEMLRAALREQMAGRERALDRCDRLFAKFEASWFAGNQAFERGVMRGREEWREQSRHCPPTHEAADAFWAYWRENGETHKHGYYESTWGAIDAALKASAQS